MAHQSQKFLRLAFALTLILLGSVSPLFAAKAKSKPKAVGNSAPFLNVANVLGLWHSMTGVSPTTDEICYIGNVHLDALNEFQKGPALETAQVAYLAAAQAVSKTPEFLVRGSGNLKEYDFKSQSFPLDVGTEKEFLEPLLGTGYGEPVFGAQVFMPEEVRTVEVPVEKAKGLAADLTPFDRSVEIDYLVQPTVAGSVDNIRKVAFKVNSFKVSIVDKTKLAKLDLYQQAQLKVKPMITLKTWKVGDSHVTWPGVQVAGTWTGKLNTDRRAGDVTLQMWQSRGVVGGSCKWNIAGSFTNDAPSTTEGTIDGPSRHMVINIGMPNWIVDVVVNEAGTEGVGTIKSAFDQPSSFTLIKVAGQ